MRIDVLTKNQSKIIAKEEVEKEAKLIWKQLRLLQDEIQRLREEFIVRGVK